MFGLLNKIKQTHMNDELDNVILNGFYLEGAASNVVASYMAQLLGCLSIGDPDTRQAVRRAQASS